MKTSSFLAMEAAALYLASALNGVFTEIVLVGAVVAALGVIYKTVVVPARKFIRRVTEATEILLALRDWTIGFEHRLKALEDHLYPNKPEPPKRHLKSI